MRHAFLLQLTLLALAAHLGPDSHAQVVAGAGGSRYMQPTNGGMMGTWTRSFGVGYFNTFNDYPASFLHVNTLTGYALLPQNLSIANFGEVFRTTGLGTETNFWRMYHGGTTAGFERGQLFAEPGNSHFNLNAPNGALRFWTNTLERMKVYETGMGALPLLSGGNVSFPRDGFVGISGTPGLFGAGGHGPFTRLHLADLDPNNEGPNHYALPWGYRTWMRNGITFTGNHDHAYIGHQYYGHDSTDLVVHWSDNADKSPFGPDKLKFMFTSDNTNQPAGARSQQGLEFMRMFPVNAMQGWIGVGNFSQPILFPSTEREPTERLDILDRTIRLREFASNSPTSWQNESLTRVLVADGTDGRVYWRNWPTSGGGGADCDWTILNAGTSAPAIAHSVYTALGTDDLCPDRDDLVGIGVVPSAAKLHLRVDRTTDAVPPRGLQVELIPSAPDAAQGANVIVGSIAGSGAVNQVGLTTTVYNGSNTNHGVVGYAIRDYADAYAGSNLGVQGISNVSAGQMFAAAGVLADAAVSSGATVQRNFGMSSRAVGGGTSYGISTEASGAATNYGGYFEAWGSGLKTGVKAIATGAGNLAGDFVGDVYINGEAGCNLMLWTSDQNLKTEIQDLQGGMGIVSALRPTTYEFNVDENASLNLPSGLQRGFIAQEVAEICPDLVKERFIHGYVDHAGVEHESRTVQTLNYIGLIPVLVAALQEQQQQLASLQEQLAACCANPNDEGTRSMQDSGNDQAASSPMQDRLLRIAPNPFTERTTLYCTLERTGRMQLLANSADGRDLRVLSEAQREAGECQVEWDTSALAPGVYYITLLLDGEPLAKKAVKLRE